MSGRFFLSGVTPVTAAGAVYPLATITWYLVGTTTLTDVYTTAALTVAHTNPITLGSDGRIPEIFLSETRMKCVFKDSSGNTIPGLSFDGIDKSLARVYSEAAPSPTYPGLQWVRISTNILSERNQADSAWVSRGNVDSGLNAATVTQALTGTDTATSMTPDSTAALWQRGTDILSAASLSLPSTGGAVYNVTGTTGVNGISSAQGGRSVKLKFAGACLLTHNATSFILPGAANITTVAGDEMEFVNEAAQDASGSNWRCFSFTRASGSPVNITDQVATQINQEAGTSLVTIVTPGRQQFHPSASKFWLKATANSTTINASYNVTSIADTSTGIMTVTIATDFSSADWCCHVSVESDVGGSAGNTAPSIESGGQAAGTVQVKCRNAAGTLSDPAFWHVSGFGDQ